MRKQRIKRSTFVSNKFIKGIIISFSTLLVIYLGISIYFTNHFYFGTVLNGINVSGKTAEEADKLMASKIESYSLQLIERGDTQEQIESADLGLKYNSDGKIQDLRIIKMLLHGFSHLLISMILKYLELFHMMIRC